MFENDMIIQLLLNFIAALDTSVFALLLDCFVFFG